MWAVRDQCECEDFFVIGLGGPDSELHQGTAGRGMRGEAEGCAFKFSK